MTITKIKVGRGLTRPEGERIYYEVEAEVGPNEAPDQVKDYLEEVLAGWLGQAPAKKAEHAPKLSLDDVARLPWISYRTRSQCKSPSEPGWIMNDPSRLQNEAQKRIFGELVRIIEREGEARLGGMVFTFSGPKDDLKRFISRRQARG